MTPTRLVGALPLRYTSMFGCVNRFELILREPQSRVLSTNTILTILAD